jgi:hypothetical protein
MCSVVRRDIERKIMLGEEDDGMDYKNISITSRHFLCNYCFTAHATRYAQSPDLVCTVPTRYYEQCRSVMNSLDPL